MGLVLADNALFPTQVSTSHNTVDGDAYSAALFFVCALLARLQCLCGMNLRSFEPGEGLDLVSIMSRRMSELLTDCAKEDSRRGRAGGASQWSSAASTGEQERKRRAFFQNDVLEGILAVCLLEKSV